jgi:hypothetical protein
MGVLGGMTMEAGIRCAFISLMLFSVCAAAAPTGGLWNFDGDQPEVIARDFTGEVGQWQVVKDAGAPSGDRVLAQLAKNSRSTFNVSLLSTTALDPSVPDVEIGVSFRAIGGRIDQGGGPVWRAQDAYNYYIARYNPIEHNYRAYKVVEGRRTELASADIPASPGWHHLRITMIGNRIRCYYDGKKYLDVLDDSFTGPGQVGLWTKADAHTHFDDFRVSTVGLGQRWDASFTPSAPKIDGVMDDLWKESTALGVEGHAK